MQRNNYPTDCMEVKNIYKAPKGLIRIDAVVEGNQIKTIQITGDFFMVPEDSLLELENILKETRFERTDIEQRVEKFYKSGVSTPMLSKEDIVNAILGARNGS